MIQYVDGNLLDLAESGEFDVIVHGCNCFNTMGSGIAAQIKKRYPNVHRVDAETECGSIQKLGTYTQDRVLTLFHEFTVINAYTQYGVSRNEDVFEYASFDVILRKLAHTYNQDQRFGFPRIGQGLAGGDATRIMQSIENFARAINGSVTIVNFLIK